MSANKKYLLVLLRKWGTVTPPPVFSESWYYFTYGDAYYFTEGDPFSEP